MSRKEGPPKMYKHESEHESLGAEFLTVLAHTLGLRGALHC